MTADTALAEIQRSQPDLLVLDVMLPDISGLEVCRRLRRKAQTVRLPVIMLTARSDEVDRVVGFEVGADDYVPKPFSPQGARAAGGSDSAANDSEPPEVEGPQVIALGDLVIDVPAHRVDVQGRRDPPDRARV